jgi:hypothetical protein
VTYDPFAMLASGKRHGSLSTMQDDARCLTGLWDATHAYVCRSRTWSPPSSTCCPRTWSSPTASRLRTPRSSPRRSTRTSSEANVHTLAMSLLTPPHELHRFSDVGLEHWPFIKQQSNRAVNKTPLEHSVRGRSRPRPPSSTASSPPAAWASWGLTWPRPSACPLALRRHLSRHVGRHRARPGLHDPGAQHHHPHPPRATTWRPTKTSTPSGANLVSSQKSKHIPHVHMHLPLFWNRHSPLPRPVLVLCAIVQVLRRQGPPGAVWAVVGRPHRQCRAGLQLGVQQRVRLNLLACSDVQSSGSTMEHPYNGCSCVIVLPFRSKCAWRLTGRCMLSLTYECVGPLYIYIYGAAYICRTRCRSSQRWVASNRGEENG